MMKYYYFPVSAAYGSSSYYLRNNLYKKLSFVNDESYISYDKCLSSVVDSDFKQIKEMVSVKDNFILLGDSGGYQFITNRLNFNDTIKKKIFHQLDNYTDYAMNLDLPPVNISFEESLKRSLDNYEYFNVNQSGHTKFISVIHGDTFDELNKWLESVNKFNFEGGYSLGGLVTSKQKLYKIMMFFSILYKNNILQNLKEYQLVHLLGVTDLKILILVFYFVNNINTNFILSFDSSFNIVYSFVLKNMVLKYSISESSIKVPVNDLKDTYFCKCPICQDKEITELCLTDNRCKGQKRYAHNHYKFVNDLEELWNLCKVDKSILKRTFVKQADVFDVIDEMIMDKENCDKILRCNSNKFIVDEKINQIDVDDLF